MSSAQKQSLSSWYATITQNQAIGSSVIYHHTNEVNSCSVQLTVTNVVIHYIKTSAVAEMATPISQETAIVNVMTEIEGGTIAIPESWAENYPAFAATFGTDFSASLTKATGKKDASGMSLQVWQDFVAGTDPTDENDVFQASVTLVDGVPIISYTPELSSAETAKRIYTVFAKEKLTDVDWHDVTSLSNADRASYNFFKVTVKMR